MIEPPPPAADDTLTALASRLARSRGDADGRFLGRGGIATLRGESPRILDATLHRPVLCLILQGAKEVTIGAATQEFVAGQSVLIAAHVPVASRITAATRATPYVAFAADLDFALVHELTEAMGTPTPTPITAPTAGAPPDAAPMDHRRAVMLDETTAAIRDTVQRILRLHRDRPEALPLLLPAQLRELHYWLLAGPHGDALRRLARPGGHDERIARAIAILRAEYDRPIPVPRLAAAAGMSPSAFHAHFRAATSLTPGQFAKHLRLIEARRLLRHERRDTGSAAFAVGYASVTQFTREYRRMFGAPPRRDTTRAAAADAARTAPSPPPLALPPTPLPSPAGPA